MHIIEAFFLDAHNLTIFIERQGLILDNFHDVEEIAYFDGRVRFQKSLFIVHLRVVWVVWCRAQVRVAKVLEFLSQLVKIFIALQIILTIKGSLQNEKSRHILQCLMLSKLQIYSVDKCESSILDIKIDNGLFEFREEK